MGHFVGRQDIFWGENGHFGGKTGRWGGGVCLQVGAAPAGGAAHPHVAGRPPPGRPPSRPAAHGHGGGDATESRLGHVAAGGRGLAGTRGRLGSRGGRPGLGM